MTYLFENWWLLIIIIASLTVIGYAIFTFIKMPTNQQLAKVREWLLYAVAKAEKELGSGTGQLKLRYVYDMFILRFEPLSHLISFEAFSVMVDETLEDFREILDTNQSVANYIVKE